MSDQATAAFKAAWAGKDQREAATLFKVELTRPSTRTLYLSAREEIWTPGAPAQVWEGGLINDAEPILSPGSLRESSWGPSSTSFTLVNDSFNYQTGDAKVLDAFAEYGWIGATVTIYLWEKSLTSLSDALTFRGFVVQDVELDRWLVTVRLIKRFGWNREADLPPVTRKTRPRAPEASLNQFVPKVRGAVRSIGMRPPWAAEYDGTSFTDSNQHGHEHMIGGRRALPGVTVDAGGGGASPGTPTKIAFASHWCRSFGLPERGCVPYIDVDGKLALFDPATLDIFNDNTDGAGFNIGDVPNGGTDPFGPAFLPVVPVNIELAAADNAENPRAALDIANDTSYARLNHNSNYKNLTARLPSIAPAGDIVGCFYCFLYRMVSGSPVDVIFRGRNTVSGNTAVLAGASSSTSPVFQSVLDAAPVINSGWEFGEIVVEVITNAAGVALDVFGVGLIVKFRPKRETVGETTTEQRITLQDYTDVSDPGQFPGTRPAPYTTVIYAKVPVYSYAASKWFATLEGYIDDATGTYTGTAAPSVAICECNSGGANPERITRASGSFVTDGVEKGALLAGTIAARFPADTRVVSVDSATQLTMSKDSTSSTGGGGEQGSFPNTLIERAPDIAQHLLVLDGGEATSDITTASSTFGSFVDARADLKTWRQSDMVHALVLTEPERASRALDRLASDAGCWFYLSEFDDKWKCVVWRAGAAVDGAEPIEKLSLAAPPRLRPTPGSRRETGVRVMYGYDHFRGHPVHECSIGPGRSNSGHKYLNLRDQQLTVVASGAEQNNKLDFRTGATDYTATLTTGEYADGWTASQDVKTAMNSAVASDWVAGYGPKVVAGVNDTIPLWNSVSGYTPATIAAGDHGTMEALAAAVQAALLAADGSGGFTCTYSRTTRKISIYNPAVLIPREIRWAAGAVANKRAMALLGFKRTDLVGPATHVAEYEREEERIHIGNLTAAFDLEWQTGTNGTDGTNTNCATLLGFDPARDDDSSGSTDVSFMAESPTNTREQLIVDTVAVTDSERPPAILDGQTIYDHDTAREVRDRFADLLLVDRPEAEFAIVDMPWIERGRVYECAASVDDLIPYAVEGSDGSWVGKKFQVLSKVQHIFGSYVTEITTAEVS